MADFTNPDPVARSDALDARLADIGIPTDLIGLRRFVAKQQTVIRWLMVSIIFDVIFSVVLGYYLFRVDTVATKANAAVNAAYISCLSGNQARATERTLWDYVLGLPPNAPQTQAQKDQIVAFKGFLNTNLAARDCTLLLP